MIVRAFAVAAIVAVSVIAVFDHRMKVGRMDRAHVDSWLCVHRGTGCGRPTAAAIEASWAERENAYAATVGILAVVGAGAHWKVRRSRRSRPSPGV